MNGNVSVRSTVVFGPNGNFGYVFRDPRRPYTEISFPTTIIVNAASPGPSATGSSGVARSRLFFSYRNSFPHQKQRGSAGSLAALIIFKNVRYFRRYFSTVIKASRAAFRRIDSCAKPLGNFPARPHRDAVIRGVQRFSSHLSGFFVFAQLTANRNGSNSNS